MTMTMPAWKAYQEATAAYYRGLGLSAETDEEIKGARGKHKVDVAVRGRQPGVDFLWIVECKFWSRSVEKAVVSAVMSISQDVGADRGIILSRKGFQAGATALARNSNITLTSLDELKADTRDEYIEYQCALVRQRCKAIAERGDAGEGDVKEKLFRVCRTDRGLSGRPNWRVRIMLLENAIDRAARDKWPVDLIVVADGVASRFRVDTFENLQQIVGDALTAIEHELGVA